MGDVAVRVDLSPGLIQQVILEGNLIGLSNDQRVEYYDKFCDHVGLDPITRPFDFITHKGRMTLYANKSASDQLRKKFKVSITNVSKEIVNDTCVITVTGQMGEREINSQGTETMVLRRSDDGWRIVHIHWSSRRQN